MGRLKNIFPGLLLLVFIASQLFVSPGCANIIPPSGGPRDTTPPVLLFVTPADSTRNFDENRIVFEFDEYVELQDIPANLIVSPTPLVNPQVNRKLKTVTVRLKDSLEENTTYSINFGNAIVDYNEKNPLGNFTYVFSTGNRIDSLELEGKVILAETGRIDSTLIVMLHRNLDDSAVYKERPRYFAKLDTAGKFHFRYLPPGTFNLYAVQDQGGQRRYTDSTQLFAFNTEPVSIENNDEPITLYAYAYPKPQAALGSGISIADKNEQDKRLKFTTNVTGPLDLFGDVQLNFEHPLQSLDTTMISLYTDSSFIPFTNYKTTIDSSKKQLKFTAGWKPGTSYHLILQKEFATDTLGHQLLRADTISFNSRVLKDYGSVSIRFRNLETYTNPVLQFVLNDQVVSSYPLTTETFTQPLFLPGDYRIRILNDTNGNGVWDPGKFFGIRRQPEIVRPVTSRTANIKADWENEFEIELPVSQD